MKKRVTGEQIGAQFLTFPTGSPPFMALTNSLFTDITLLSSYISETSKKASSWQFKFNRSNAEQDILDHLTTLANVKHSSQDIRIVAQTNNAEGVKCDIFIPITPCPGQIQVSSFTPQPAILDPKKGSKVLANWDHDNDKYV